MSFLLETCWYLSPPWDTKPTPIVKPLERVYIPGSNDYGYCCGYKWERGRIVYTIAVFNKSIITGTEEIFIPLNNQAKVLVDPPIFEIGDVVEIISNQVTGNNRRIVLGIRLLVNSWVYIIEWEPPGYDSQAVIGCANPGQLKKVTA